MKNISLKKLFLELLVVFLGVTAGFVLQNRKEIAANKEMEVKYLQDFYSDVNMDITELRTSITNDSLWLKRNEYALLNIFLDSLSLDSANSLVIQMSRFSEFTNHINTYTNISNSGNLNLITDYELKRTIVEYYKTIEDFKLLEDYFKSFSSDTFMPFIINDFDMFNQKLVNPEIRNSTKFTNVFAIYYSLTQQRLEGYKNLLTESENFKSQLDDLGGVSTENDG